MHTKFGAYLPYHWDVAMDTPRKEFDARRYNGLEREFGLWIAGERMIAPVRLTWPANKAKAQTQNIEIFFMSARDR